MKSVFLIIPLLLLAACNWAEPPLPSPNSERDARLLGDWTSVDERKIKVQIAPLEESRYRVIVEGASNRLEFTGYHTDIEGLKLVSLELQHPPLSEGRQMRWLILGYEFHDDGSFSPLFISKYVQSEVSGPLDYIKLSGEQIFAMLASAARSDHHRARFFDRGMEEVKFKKE